MHNPFSLRLPHLGRSVRVQSFKGRERVSSCYRFRVHLEHKELGDAPPLTLLGEPAVLRILGPAAGPREVHGLVSDIRDCGHGVLRLRIEPRLALLGLHHASRIFQEMTVPAVISEVLGDADVPCSWALEEGYVPRSYCVQYQESALAFVQRLCAEEGIFYFFTGGDDIGETVVFADNPAAYTPLAGEPTLVYRPPQRGMRGGEQDLHRFELGRRLRSSRVLARGYDPLKPAFDGSGKAAFVPSFEADVDDPRVQSHYQHGRAPIVHHRENGVRPHLNDERAAVLLDQLRRHAWRAEGESACSRLIPGATFKLEGRDELWAAADGYVVESVEHAGHPAEAGHEARYDNRFAAAPASTPLRPALPQRVLRQAAETALVVGGEHQEVYTDPLGRIKIQFFWDREGARNEHSSCWVRVAQAWAGDGWGAQFVPRVGMEVLVLFEAGDVDRPIVAGCLPNARTIPPFDPSREVSRSGWRTRSLGGSGSVAESNELSFDDAKGREEILIRSEGDLRVITRRTHSIKCAEQSVVVQGRRTERLGASETVVMGGCSLVADAVSRRVAGDVSDLVSGTASLAAGAGEVRIAGDQRQEIAGEATTLVGGCFTTIVGRATAPASWTTHAMGAAVLSAEGVLELTSEKEIVLRVGATSLRIGPNGIDILGGALRASDGAGGLVTLGPKGIRVETPGEVRVQAERLVAHSANASMDLHRDVALDGENILLNSPTEADDAPPVQPRVLTLVRLADQDGAPVAAARFVVTLGEERRSGVLDAKGQATLEDGEKIIFPDHDVAGAPVTALGPRTHVVKSGEHLAQIAAQLGLDAAAVWGHAKNAGLRALRADPHILAEGDVLWFDAVERGAQGLKPGNNPFRAHIRKMETHLRLAGPDTRPLAGEPFEAEVDGLPPQRGATDGDGKLTVIHPCAARACTVRLTRLGKVLRLDLGHVDPADTVTGIAQRLAALGHYKGSPSAQLDEATTAALQVFQRSQGLAATGKITKETTDAIVAAYGS